MATYLRCPVDVEKIAESYDLWQKEYHAMVEDHEKLRSTVATLSKQHQLSRQALHAANEEKEELQNLIQKWQGFVSKLCNLEEENGKLKQQLEDERASSAIITEAHRGQRDDLLKELSDIRATHSTEMERLQQMAQQQGRRDKALLEKQIEEKSGEIRQLQKRLTNMEREKHNELVKLRLEYDGKLLRLQKQLAKGQPSSTASVNNDIFRKKLENCKMESSREISQLKKRISDLEQQLAVTKAQASYRNKR
eukprot:scpid90201/ scgid14987/ Coiled-coil domain-containing protein 152